MIDAGLLAAGDLDWLSNVDDNHPDSAGPRQARTLLYHRAASMPAESMLIGNIHGELPTKEESFATEIGSAPLLLGDLTKLSVGDQDWYHAKTEWFKKLRKDNRISESFFPLGHWTQPSAAEWDGFARLARSGNGLIALFRNKSGVASVEVEMPLMPDRRVRLHSVMNGKDLGVFTKADWKRGVRVEFAGLDPVEILELTAVN